MALDDRRYAYEPRSVVRARERARALDLQARIAPLVRAGDSFSLLRAQRIMEQAREAARERPLRSLEHARAAVAEEGRESEARPEAGSERLSRSPLERLADLFREAVPQGVRDVAGRGLRFTGEVALETGEEFLSGRKFVADKAQAFTLGRVSEEEAERALERLPGLLSDVIDVAASPATLATAGVGGEVGAVLRAAAPGSRLARIGASLIEPVAPRGSGFAFRLGAETAAGVGATRGAQEVAERIPEDAPGPVKLLAPVVGGLVGGGIGAGAANLVRGAGRGVSTALREGAIREAAPEAFQFGRGRFEDVIPRARVRGGALRFEPGEDTGRTIRLYRGDARPVEFFSLDKTSVDGLFGRGIYLTDSRAVARSYTTKGSDDVIGYALGARTKREALQSAIRNKAFDFRMDGMEPAAAEEAAERFFRETPHEFVRRGQLSWDVVRKRPKEPITTVRMPEAFIRRMIDAEAPLTEADYHAMRRALEQHIGYALTRELAERDPSMRPALTAIEDSLRRFDEVVAPFEDEGSFEGTPFAGKRDIRTVRAGDETLTWEGNVGERPTFAQVWEWLMGETPEPTSRERLQTRLRRAFSDIGRTGIRYDGGQRIPGNLGRHNAYVIWDEQGFNRLLRGESPRPSRAEFEARSAADEPQKLELSTPPEQVTEPDVIEMHAGLGAFRPPPVTPRFTLPGAMQPGSIARELYGARDLEAGGLSSVDQVLNALKGTLGIGTPTHEIATPVMRERARLLENVRSLAAQAGATVDAIAREAFVFDADGRIRNLASGGPIEAPTLADLAARLPSYRAAGVLTPDQEQALARIETILRPFRAGLEEAGISVHSRADVEPDGFYLPRGSAEIEGGEPPLRQSGRGRRPGIRAGFERGAVFRSQVEGIEAGYDYGSVGEAVRTYVEDAGRRTVDQIVANYFKTARDPATGELLGETARARLLRQNPELAARVDGLRQRLQGLRQTGLRLADRTDAAIEQFIHSPAPDLDDLQEALELTTREELFFTSDVVHAPDLPDVAVLDAQIEELRKAIVYVGDERLRPSRSKENLARMRKLGELEALQDLRILLDRTQGDPLATIDALEQHLEQLSRALEIIDDPANRARALSSRYRARRSSGRKVDLYAQETAIAGGDELETVRARASLLFRIWDTSGVDARRQEITADDLTRAFANVISRTARRLQLRVGRSATGRQGPNYGLTHRQVIRHMNGIRRELKALMPEWRRALERARQTPRREAQLQFAQLQGTTFNEHLAAAVNGALEAERPPAGRGAALPRTVEAVNQLLRGIRATADVSFMGIQGLLGAARDPSAYRQAMRVAVRAIGNAESLGAYMVDFNVRAARTGRFGTADWARYGLHFGGDETEFAIGRGVVGRLERVSRLPVIRQSNRAFGYFGDVLRLELADTLLEAARASGRTLDDEALRQIARTANLMTGWSPNRFAGSWGDLLLFAPRFFSAQLQLVGDALTRGDLAGNNARVAFVRLLGAGALLTIGANALLGNETEFDPTSSNFMRIRFAGNDYSLFGPWDSLLRAVVGAAQGIAEGKPFEGAAYLMRSKSSPAVGIAWDLITGKTFTGEEVGADTLLRGLLPFSLQDLGENVGRAVGGDVGGLAAQATDLLGLKSTPVTPNEQLDQIARNIYHRDFWDLEPYQREAIREANPELWQRAVQHGSEQRQRAEAVRSEIYQRQLTDDERLLAGEITRREWREARAGRRDELRARLKEIYGDAERDGEPRNVYERYLQIIDRHSDGERVDWDAVDAEVATLPADQRQEIERSIGVGQTPLSREYVSLIAQYAELPIYRGYTAAEARQIDELSDEIAARSRGSDLRALRALRELAGQYDERIVRAVRKRILGLSLRRDDEREKFRKRHPVLDIMLGDGRLTERDRAVLQREGMGMVA